MNRVIFVILGALLAAPFVSSAAERPLAVLVERDPWLMVVGSDSPSIALYSDGKVIMRNTEGSGYVQGKLADPALQTLLSKIAPRALLALEDSYTTTRATDQPANELHVWVDGRHKLVSVYGDIGHQADERRKAPQPFVQAFDAFKSITLESPTEWVPEQIQLLIWPFEHSLEEPQVWPKGWPSFDQARPRGSRGLHELFLPSDQYPRLCELLQSLGPKQAIVVANRKWTISYRFPFPSESEWAR